MVNGHVIVLYNTIIDSFEFQLKHSSILPVINYKSLPQVSAFKAAAEWRQAKQGCGKYFIFIATSGSSEI